MRFFVALFLGSLLLVFTGAGKPSKSEQSKKVLYCPKQCECANEIFLEDLTAGVKVNCTGRSLRNFPLPLPPKTSTLLLEGNRINYMRFDFFAGLGNLRTLDLSNNRFTKLRYEAFGFLPQLKKLSLRANRIREIEFGSFRNITNVETLILSENKLVRLSYGMFDILNHLRALDLGRNNISEIQDGSFLGLKRLRTLFLNDNWITSVSSQVLPDVYNLQSLYLYRNRISKIEPDAFQRLPYLQILSLADNQLTRLSREMFSGLRSVKSIFLQRNKVTKIQPWTFTQLKGLQALYLYSNFLTIVEKSTFAELRNLRILHIGANRIQYTIDDSFKDLQSLVTLYLDSNQLTVISRNTFVGLTSVKDIHLYFNKLRYVAKNAFAPATSLARIVWDVPDIFRRTRPDLRNLIGNILHCDCNALYFRDWLRTRGNQIQVTCQTPPRLKGVQLVQLNDSDIKCDPVAVSVSPKKKLVQEGDDVELYCTVNTGAVYTWTINGTAVHLDEYHTISPLGTLKIVSVSKQRDVGEYACIAQNAAGVSAASLELYVGVRPTFTALPVPVEAKEPGKPVLFKCSARGVPPPVISWKKDGHLISWASSGNSQYQITTEGALLYLGKRHHITREGSLIIFDPNQDDEGTYTCEAENEVGKTIHRVTLYIDISEKCSCSRGGVCRASAYQCHCTTGFHKVGDQCKENENEKPTLKPTRRPTRKPSGPTRKPSGGEHSASGSESGDGSGVASGGESGSGPVEKKKKPTGSGSGESSGSGVVSSGESSGSGGSISSGEGNGKTKNKRTKNKGNGGESNPPIDQEESGDEVPTRPSTVRRKPTTHRPSKWRPTATTSATNTEHQQKTSGSGSDVMSGSGSGGGETRDGEQNDWVPVSPEIYIDRKKHLDE